MQPAARAGAPMWKYLRETSPTAFAEPQHLATSPGMFPPGWAPPKTLPGFYHPTRFTAPNSAAVCAPGAYWPAPSQLPQPIKMSFASSPPLTAVRSASHSRQNVTPLRTAVQGTSSNAQSPPWLLMNMAAQQRQLNARAVTPPPAQISSPLPYTPRKERDAAPPFGVPTRVLSTPSTATPHYFPQQPAHFHNFLPRTPGPPLASQSTRRLTTPPPLGRVPPAVAAFPSVPPSRGGGAPHSVRPVTPPPITSPIAAIDVGAGMSFGLRGAPSSPAPPCYMTTRSPDAAGEEPPSPVAGLDPAAPPMEAERPPSPNNAASSGGWVSVSTANMSPFTILRIKALIELTGVASYSPAEEIRVKVEKTHASRKGTPLVSCLKKKTDGKPVAESEAAAESLDAHCIRLLNDLLEQSQTARRDTKQVLAEVNSQLGVSAEEEVVEGQGAGESVGRKLAFSTGATVICFDSGDKPRKIRENHGQHYAELLWAQEQWMRAAASPGTVGASSSPAV